MFEMSIFLLKKVYFSVSRQYGENSVLLRMCPSEGFFFFKYTYSHTALTVSGLEGGWRVELSF